MVVASHNPPAVNCRLPPGWTAYLLQILLVAVAAATLQAADCDPPPPGLVSWWPAEGNANDIVGTNNGVLMGGATANAPGVVGRAFQFDGTNGYVQIPDSPALHPANLTVEAWVLFRTLDTPAHGTYPGQNYIVFKQNSRSQEFEGIALEKDRYPPYVGTNDTFCWETASSAGVLVFLESVTTIETNVWYYVAGVRGSNYLQLYVNGRLEAQTNVNFPQDYGNQPLYFGTSGESYYDCKLGGSLDEVSLYNRALTSNEIAAIYAAGSAGKCRSLASSLTSLSLSTNLVTYGTPVTFTSTVTGSGTTPTGTVAFMDGPNALGTGSLDGSGATSFSTNKLSVAGSPHSITAVYGGDVNFAGSTSGPVSLAIAAATITPGVTVSNKTYDGTISATISNRTPGGIVNGDDVNLGTSGFASFSDRNVGTGKTVTVTGLALSGTTAGNYQLSSTTATTTASISAQTLTVTAEDKTRWFGAANPALTAQFSGFVAGETTNVLAGSPDLGTTATSGSPSGDYPIAASLGTLSATNYTFTFVNGTLTVLALPRLSIDDAKGSLFIFSFPTVSGQTYQVEYNSNLVSGTWFPLGGLITGGGSPVFVTNDMIDPQDFFRLNLQP